MDIFISLEGSGLGTLKSAEGRFGLLGVSRLGSPPVRIGFQKTSKDCGWTIKRALGSYSTIILLQYHTIFGNKYLLLNSAFIFLFLSKN